MLRMYDVLQYLFQDNHRHTWENVNMKAFRGSLNSSAASDKAGLAFTAFPPIRMTVQQIQTITVLNLAPIM